MGMSWKAPSSNYERRRYVADHAVERLRERLTTAGRTEHRSDGDLGNWIDWMVEQAVAKGTLTTEGDQRVVEVTEFTELEMCAVVKADKHDPKREAVVTMLNGTLADRERERNAGPPVAKLGDAIGDRLRAVKPAPPQAARPAARQVDTRLITWREGGKDRQAEYPAAEMPTVVGALLTAADQGSLRVWRPVTLRVRVEEE